MKTLELENNHSVATVDLRRIHTWWRAANYLSVGQIYLLDNPLLAVPLKAEHIKPRLLGHWGTTPGLNFLYAHLNRVINCRNLNVLPVIGSGHGGPALVANAWLEGSYSELCPELTRDADGMKRLFRQFSFPVEFPVTVPQMFRGRFTREGSWGIRWRTPLALPSTILNSSSPA